MSTVQTLNLQRVKNQEKEQKRMQIKAWQPGSGGLVWWILGESDTSAVTNLVLMVLGGRCHFLQSPVLE